MKKLVGGETRRRAPLRVHGQHCPRHQAYQVFGTFLFHQESQVLFHHTFLSLTKRLRRVGIGYTCGYLNVEGIQHWFVPSSVTADAHILIRVHLLSCSIGFKPLFDQHFQSLLTCDFLIAREHTGEARQATGDH